MVRINLIDVKYILDQHLLAEYNEILMLCGYVRKYYPFISDIPEKYCLGKGHIKFFSNKLTYLKRRFYTIKQELVFRGYQVEKEFPFQSPKENEVKDWQINRDVAMWHDYKPTAEAYGIIIKRLHEKVLMKTDKEGKINFYTYYGKTITITSYTRYLNIYIEMIYNTEE